MSSNAGALFAAFVWLCLAALIDRRNARREGLQTVCLADICIVFAVSAGAVFVTPAPERLAVAIAVTGLGVAAFGDLRNGYLWEELTVPTLLAVLGASAISGTAQNAIAGTAVLGAIALAVYFAGQLARQDSGFGDVIPTAVIGAAFGPLLGLGAFTIACGLFGIGAAALGKRSGALFPFGPAIVVALLIGVAGSSLFVGTPP